MEMAISFEKSHFGKIIEAINARKESSYSCIKCGEDVILRKGDKNVHHFSHRKADQDNKCELRVSKLYEPDTSIKTSIEDIKKWFKQQKDAQLEYVPELPEYLFTECTTWQSIAQVLVDEINKDIRFHYNEFSEKIAALLRKNTYGITRYLLDKEHISEDDLLKLYWEIYLKFRLLHTTFISTKKDLIEGQYEIINSYIKDKIKSEQNDDILTPFSLQIDVENYYVKCMQKTKNGIRPVDLTSMPSSMQYLNATPEIKKISKLNYLITKYDEFESSYVSTNSQVPIGSKVMILGELKQLEQLLPSIVPFCEERIEITCNICNLDKKWGAILFEIVMPEKMTLSDCPDWIAWRYLEFYGGLRLKLEDQPYTFLRSCPPAIQLNANIKTDLVEIYNEKKESVLFRRNGNFLFIENTSYNHYTVLLKKTPYAISFYLTSPQEYKEISEYEKEWGWMFTGRWPTVGLISDKLNLPILSGVALVGCWYNKMDPSIEWSLIHSGMLTIAENTINNMLTTWRPNAFRQSY